MTANVKDPTGRKRLSNVCERLSESELVPFSIGGRPELKRATGENVPFPYLGKTFDSASESM
jgi:hypothetical protein